MEIKTRNVNTAFNRLIKGIADGSIPTRKEDTRNGPVIQIDEPAMVTYEKPTERVLFNTERDCNPFFHVFEAMWMLAGRNDIFPLAYYAPNVANYSDDGQTFNGAYGHRWRHAANKSTEIETGIGAVPKYTEVDQLDCIVNHLTRLPNSRRAILQMWNVEDDLLKIGSDLECMRDNLSKDVCCNLSVLFSIRTECSRCGDEGDDCRGNARSRLDMTVTNRSNDLVWGMLGANYVHFSFLQEYLACRLGIEVGRYTQFSNNLHIYTESNSGFHPEKWLQDSKDLYTVSSAMNMVHVPLVRDPVMFDREVKEFVEYNSTYQSIDNRKDWNEPFFQIVGQPMMCAFHHHKAREYPTAITACSEIHATDWRLAASRWIVKRRKNYETKTQKVGE